LNERGPLPARPDDLGRLVIDGRDLGPLGEASGLPGGGAGADLSKGASGGSPGSPSAAFRWREDDPLSYDRSVAVTIEGRGVVDVERDQGQAVTSRVVVFWYSDRPAGRPGAGSLRGAP
jgi:hypothetical protein